MTPGLIDCHTHLVYGGNRVDEFEKRLCGVSYEDIARAGGGIQSTINATRAADAAELRAAAAVRAMRLMSEGVTTIEVKSGYGLDLPGERRLLEVARSLERDLPVSIRTTYLGLHALPQEYLEDRRSYIDQASGPWLEALSRRRSGRCRRRILREHRLFGGRIRAIPPSRTTPGRSRTPARGSIERHGGGGAGGAIWRALRRSPRILERARRTSARCRGYRCRAAAVRLLYPAPDNPTAGPAAAQGGRADGGGDRLQSGHLPMHIAAARSRYGLHPVRL